MRTFLTASLLVFLPSFLFSTYRRTPVRRTATIPTEQEFGGTFCSKNAVADTVWLPDKKCTSPVVPGQLDGADVLAGVNSYDIYLISQHILGSAPFASPYQWIAADVNRSNSVTTNDAVEIRKLILMINTELPNGNTSWRFVDKHFVFPNPNNPFQTTFPEQISLVPPSSPSNPADFYAIKIGDINGSCDMTCPGFAGDNVEGRASTSFAVGVPNTVKKGDIVTLPFRMNAPEQMIAFQSGIHFDPSALKLVGPSKGDLENYPRDNFGLTQLDKGYIRTLWFTADEMMYTIEEGNVLFNLTFEALSDVADLSAAISLDDDVLMNMAFNKEGTAFPLKLTFEKATIQAAVQQQLRASCFPNPFSNTLNFEVEAPDAFPKASVWLFDAFGTRLYYKEISLEKGKNTVLVDNMATIPSGVVSWQVRTPSGKASGVIVKQ